MVCKFSTIPYHTALPLSVSNVFYFLQLFSLPFQEPKRRKKKKNPTQHKGPAIIGELLTTYFIFLQYLYFILLYFILFSNGSPVRRQLISRHLPTVARSPSTLTLSGSRQIERKSETQTTPDQAGQTHPFTRLAWNPLTFRP